MSNKTLEIVTNKIQIIINRETTDRLCLRKIWYRPLNFLILKRLGMFFQMLSHILLFQKIQIQANSSLKQTRGWISFLFSFNIFSKVFLLLSFTFPSVLKSWDLIVHDVKVKPSTLASSSQMMAEIPEDLSTLQGSSKIALERTTFVVCRPRLAELSELILC